MRQFIFFFLLTLAASTASARSENLGNLYDTCTASDIPAVQRTREDWVNVQKCEDFIYAAVIRLKWFPEAIREQDWGGFKYVENCPSRENIDVRSDRGSFSKTKLVQDFLAYWAAADAGRFTRLMLDAREAVETAFKSSYPNCRSIEKAPPCKDGSPTCNPWERDWRETALKPGSTVTNEGAIIQPAPTKP